MFPTKWWPKGCNKIWDEHQPGKMDIIDFLLEHTPRKINMEPEDAPLEEEKSSAKQSFSGSMFIFGGVIDFTSMCMCSFFFETFDDSAAFSWVVDQEWHWTFPGMHVYTRSSLENFPLQHSSWHFWKPTSWLAATKCPVLGAFKVQRFCWFPIRNLSANDYATLLHYLRNIFFKFGLKPPISLVLVVAQIVGCFVPRRLN